MMGTVLGGRRDVFKMARPAAYAGATASANLYSLLQTCQANGIDGYRYLRTLITELPKARSAEDYAALLPWRIAIAETCFASARWVTR